MFWKIFLGLVLAIATGGCAAFALFGIAILYLGLLLLMTPDLQGFGGMCILGGITSIVLSVHNLWKLWK